MKRYGRRHLSDSALLRQTDDRFAHDCSHTADLLADLAEVDTRKLYRPAGYESMYAFCLGRWHLSEDSAYKRIKAARAARRFPAIFVAVADGRLHLSAVVMLAPHLTEDSAEELLAAATRKTKLEIQHLLAARYPQPDVPSRIEALTPAESVPQQAPGPVAEAQPVAGQDPERLQQAPGPVGLVPEQVMASPVQSAPADARSKVRPLAPERYAVQFTMSQSAHDKLRYVQDLLGHQVAPGDIAQVFERALEALIPELEQRRFAATATPHRSSRHSGSNPRHIPARVRRAVWKRDGAQCTYVSEDGKRCDARKDLQFDHVLEVARGGEPSDGIRLRCWAHNQHQAECTFGAEFMRHKRNAAAEARAASRNPT